MHCWTFNVYPRTSFSMSQLHQGKESAPLARCNYIVLIGQLKSRPFNKCGSNCSLSITVDRPQSRQGLLEARIKLWFLQRDRGRKREKEKETMAFCHFEEQKHTTSTCKGAEPKHLSLLCVPSHAILKRGEVH